MSPDLSIPIETNRLSIRPYRTDDVTMYHQMSLRNKEHLARYESDNPIMSIDSLSDAEKVINDFVSLWDEQRYRFLGVFLKESGDFVAQIYLGKLNNQLPEFGIGYFADIDHVGNGFVTEAVKALVEELFEVVGAHRLQIETDDTNSRSIGVAERCCFLREGHLRKNKLAPDGALTGTLFFGLLKEEYSISRKRNTGE